MGKRSDDSTDAPQTPAVELVPAITAKLVDEAPSDAMVARAEDGSDVGVVFDTTTGMPVSTAENGPRDPNVLTSGDIAATGKPAEGDTAPLQIQRPR